MATPSEKEAFSIIIAKKVANEKITVLEAIMDYCELTHMEVEVAATLLNDSLKQALEFEAQKGNLLKKTKPPIIKTGKNPTGKGKKK
jgi:hypothetical protein